MKARKHLFALLATSTLLANAYAQQYPERPLRFVVPFPAGGTPDANARAVGGQLQIGLKQTIVIDNRSGADGIIGSHLVAKAPPDGYTFMYTGQAFLTNAATHLKLPYDVRKDFAPVTQIAVSDGYVLVVYPPTPASNVKELIALSKTPGKQLRYGSPGIGSSQQLAAELFNFSTGAQLVHVPYRGLAPAIAALLGGDEIQVGFAPLTVVASQIGAGRLRAVAITAEARWKLLPEVPTVSESIPGFKFIGGWHGLFAPAKTPPAILARIHTEVQQALMAPKLRDFLRTGGYEPVGSSPDEFRKFISTDLDKWLELARVAKIEQK